MERRYGKWSGYPPGFEEDKERCMAEVLATGPWRVPHQCNRKRGYGPHGGYCKQHAQALSEGRHVYVPKKEKTEEEKDAELLRGWK